MRICQEEKKPPKQYKEQYGSRSSIAEHWICPNCAKTSAKTAAKESSTILGSRTQSTLFEFSLASITISTVTNPSASLLDGTDQSATITEETLDPNGMFHCRLDWYIDGCPAIPHKNRRFGIHHWALGSITM